MKRTFLILLALIITISSNVLAQGPISGFYYPADEMVNDWQYYASRSFYVDNNHLGADVDLAEGVAIKAIARGKIVYYAGASSYGALVVAIEHELPEEITFLGATGELRTTRYVLSIYGHLRKSAERVGAELPWQYGDIVQQGDIIGYVNNSSHPDGIAPDPNGDGLEHLHLGIRLSNEATAKAQDGSLWLRGYNNNSGMQIYFTNPIPLVSGLAQFAQSPSWQTENGVSLSFMNTYNASTVDDHPLGMPWQNTEYGSMYVHEVNNMLIQDFQDLRDEGGPSNGYYNPYTAIIRYDDPWMSREARLLKEGFWDVWMNRRGWITFGFPTTDEELDSGRVWQTFRRPGFNYQNNPNDYKEFHFRWDSNTQSLDILDQYYNPVMFSELVVEPGSPSTMLEMSGNNYSASDIAELKEATGNKEVTGGGSMSENNPFKEMGLLDSSTKSLTNGVYHSGIKVAAFGEAFELVEGNSYGDFYAVVNGSMVLMDSFTMNGNMVIYIDDSPPVGELQFGYWTISPNPGNVGQSLHLEGEVYNVGGSPVTISEVKIELIDPSGNEAYHYSEYNVVLQPGSGWYQWMECYPYMPGNHTVRFRGLVDGQWTTFSTHTVYVEGSQIVSHLVD